MSVQKSEIKLDVNGQPLNAYLAAPKDGGSAVLVLHAWWGLKLFFKELCDRFAEEGFTALAPDLRNGQIAETIEGAKELMEKSDDKFVGEVVMAAKDHLLTLSKTGRIGVIGFSMGAAWAMEAAMEDPDKVAATVLFYGAVGGDFKKVRSKVQGHFSENDEWEPIEYVREMEKGMRGAGLDVTLHFYPEVAHWFVESDRPEYDSAAASLAWNRTFEFLRKNL